MRRSNHTVSVFKYVQYPSQANGMLRHATIGKDPDNSFRDRRVGKKQGDVIQFQRGMKENF